MATTKLTLLRLSSLVIAALISLLLAEITLRQLGHYRWRYSAVAKREPIMHQADANLGWRNLPGSYAYPGYAPPYSPIRVTILPDGSRRTAQVPSVSDKDLIMIGGSFIRGSAISDADTLGWKLQAAHQNIHISNFGTGAYGTYQSLLLLKEILAGSNPPWRVLYGLTSYHEHRNVGSTLWRMMLAFYSRSGLAKLPRVEFSKEGELVGHPPTGPYVPWPFARSSVLVATLQDSLGRYRDADRMEQAEEATQELLLRMRGSCNEVGSKFSVLILVMPDDKKPRYIDFMTQKEIAWVDCSYPLTPELVIAGEGHPNGRLNSLWATCVSEKLDTWSMGAE